MSEEQSAGNGDKDRKNQSCTAGGDAACLHAPFEYRQSNYQQREKTMQQDFGIRKSRPETNGPERPGLRIAAEKKECRKAEEGERPIARPGDLSRLRDEGQETHGENDDACPVMVVFRPSFLGRSVRACSGLAGDVGFGRERAGFECFFLSGVNVFGKLLKRRTGESWRAWGHAGEDFWTGDAVVSEIRGDRE